MNRARQISTHAGLRREVVKILNDYQINPSEYDPGQLSELRQWFKLIDSILSNERTLDNKKEMKQLQDQIDKLTERMGLNTSFRLAN